MRKLLINNQEVVLDAYFLKKCLLTLLDHFITTARDLPPELRGVILCLQNDINNAVLENHSEEDLSHWLLTKILNLRNRERAYLVWFKNTQFNQKLSFLLEKMHLKLFSPIAPVHPQNKEDSAESGHEEIAQVENSVLQAVQQLNENNEKNRFIKKVKQACADYQKASVWPISQARHQQQIDLLQQLEASSNAHDATRLLQEHVRRIEEEHYSKSVAANLVLYQRDSRLVSHLRAVVTTDSRKSIVESRVELAVSEYLANDLFYHNRSRRRMIYLLLSQLRTDHCNHLAHAGIAGKYKMRTTLDDFIKKIDEAFEANNYIPTFLCTRRSRLAEVLEKAKHTLIMQGHLSALELERDIKTPIGVQIKAITMNMLQLRPHLDAPIKLDIERELIALLGAMNSAQTPYAIEAIIEGHIRSYLKLSENCSLLDKLKNLMLRQDDLHFAIAINLEHALLSWQTQNMLPAASGYKTFLESLAEQRQHNEGEIQTLEQRYGIKIPRTMQGVRAQLETQRGKAQALLQRVSSL